VIVTLTLNPAIDRYVKVKQISRIDVTRVLEVRKDPAGKGINVSKVIKKLGGKSIATGFIGGTNGEFILNKLADLKIENDFIKVQGETRENIKIHEVEIDNFLEINESGPFIEDFSVNALFDKLDELLNVGDTLVLSGSIPKGVPVDIYSKIITNAKRKGVMTVLDTSLILLKESLNAKPDIIKPNLYELEEFCGKTLNDDTDIIIEARKIVNIGINEVIVSLGKDGILYISDDVVFKVSVPTVKIESTVGAGDSFVGGLCFAYDNDYDLEEKLLFAASVATASVMTPGTNPGSIDEVNEILKNTKIKEVLI